MASDKQSDLHFMTEGITGIFWPSMILKASKAIIDIVGLNFHTFMHIYLLYYVALYFLLMYIIYVCVCMCVGRGV